MTGPLTMLIVFWGIPAFVAHRMGATRGRIGLGYGLFLSWLGVLVLALLPPLHGAGAGERRCPDCAEWVQAEATKCRFCGHAFPADGVHA